MAETDPDSPVPLSADRLCPTCAIDSVAAAIASLPDDSAPADTAKDDDGFIGQDRAQRALNLGTRIPHRGFNIFVLGPEGAGRHSLALKVAKEAAANAPAPDDWIYVHDFKTEWVPKALRLPSGTAIRFQKTVQFLIDRLRREVPAMFETDAYRERRRRIDEDQTQKTEGEFEAISKRAGEQGIGIMRTPMGFAMAPVKDGEVVKPEAFAQLPQEEQEAYQQKIAALQEEMAALLREVPEREQKHRAEIRALNAEMAATVIDAAIAHARKGFEGLDVALKRLDEIRADLLDKVELFVMDDGKGGAGAFPEAMVPITEDRRFRRYLVNVIVGREPGEGKSAPVLYEDHPTLARLVGRIEYLARMGALETDFNMIRPGALHRANGGFLVVDANRLIREPFAWEALKRALRAQTITIASPGQEMNMLSTVSLEPQPIPLDLRVVLVGERRLYYLLVELDPEFGELFKVQADFEDDLPLNADAIADYARLLRRVAAKTGLKVPDPAAIAAFIDEAARMAGDSERLSLRVGDLTDLMREADYWAGESGRGAIAGEDVRRSIEERTYRADRLRERWHERIDRETVLIDTDGRQVGQINGLSVMQVGGFAFGSPTRITARVRMGSGRVIDIERESKLGGPLHSKGVLILSAYLLANYATDVPVSLWASLVFEQSYGGVEGDSASSAELYALLSALSGISIRQDLAVTGSVNQLGEVQAIGGVNEKVEGFFDICAGRGLTGTQGVLIPQSNVKHLVLRRRVVEAVRAGDFAIWPIATIDQGIALLTGAPAGRRGPDGAFEAGSVNAAVEARLAGFAETRKAFSAKGNGSDSENGERSDDDG